MAHLMVRFESAKGISWGRLQGPAPASARDTVEVSPLDINPATTRELLGLSEKDLAFGNAIRLPATALLSPVTTDARLVCQGLNYQEHAAEAQQAARRSNLIFAKASSALSAPFGPIVRPAEVELLDYEVEIGLVLRAPLTQNAHVSKDNIGAYVAGVVLCNDVSARDTMFGASFLQWFHGKSYRTFCPAGPVFYWLAADEVASTLEGLSIKLTLNGDVRQAASSSQLIYKPAETLTHLATYLDLEAGDMLLTGTPGGVTSPASPKLVEILKTHLMADEPRRQALRAEMTKGRPFMRAGDVVRATLHDDLRGVSLGGQENTVVDAEAAPHASTAARARGAHE
jgi:2-keto-4-pentenoate hydratase/2-oxohepta-3-ene-1,7-dioic acid hydratase in catechol pathway